MEGHVLDGTMKDVNKENYLQCTTDLFLVLKKEPTFCEAIVVVCF